MPRGNLDDLAAFAVVARELSFTRAAAELKLSTSALSYLVKGLEARLGVRLLQRNSRSVAVTAAGERLLQTLGPALEGIGAALDQLVNEREVVSGAVRVTATRHAYETVVRPVLPGFCGEHPHVTVEVLVDYQLRDIIADRLDAGIRLGEKLQADMIAVRVGPDLRMSVVAAPSYLRERSEPLTPHDLMGHRCINYRMTASGPVVAWGFEQAGHALEIRPPGPLTFNEPELALDAAMDGLGIAYVLDDRTAPLVGEGRLVRLLEGWTPSFVGYFLYHPSRRHVPAALSALIAALRSRRT